MLPLASVCSDHAVFRKKATNHLWGYTAPNTVVAPTLGRKACAMLRYRGEANARNPHADQT